MGFDEDLRDGHQVYWPEKRKISVERNIKFNFDPEEVIVGDLLLEGEQSLDKCMSAKVPEPTNHVDHPGTVNSESHLVLGS